MKEGQIVEYKAERVTVLACQTSVWVCIWVPSRQVELWVPADLLKEQEEER